MDLYRYSIQIEDTSVQSVAILVDEDIVVQKIQVYRDFYRDYLHTFRRRYVQEAVYKHVDGDIFMRHGPIQMSGPPVSFRMEWRGALRYSAERRSSRQGNRIPHQRRQIAFSAVGARVHSSR
jgi:hypothetical protein